MKFKESGQWENAPAGSHVSRLFALTDLGSQSHSWQGESWTSRDVRLSFELPNELMTGIYNAEVKGKPFIIHTTVKQSLHPSSKLRKLLEGWRGKKFTKEEVSTFDPKKLLGLPCRLSLIENGEYVNIDSISPLGKGEKVPPQVNPTFYLSLEKSEFDQKAFDKLHDKTKEKIAKTVEWRALTSNEPVQTAPDDNVPFDDSDSQEPF